MARLPRKIAMVNAKKEVRIMTTFIEDRGVYLGATWPAGRTFFGSTRITR